MKKITFTIVLMIAFVVCVIAQPGAANHALNSGNQSLHEKNGNSALGISFDTTACGLSYTQATSMITTRYNQYAVNTFGHGFPDTLHLAGLPGSYTIAKAYVYFDESYTSACTTPVLSFNDAGGNAHNVDASLIGTSIAVCWGETGTYAFRADVTNYITTNGNYVITGISCATDWEVDGATLLVIYQNLWVNFEGTIVLFDGCSAIDGGSITDSVQGFHVCQVPSYGSGFVISADLQDNVAPTHATIINNVSDSFPNLFMNFDDAPIYFNAGQTSARMGISTSADCFLVSTTGIYYRDTCNFCQAGVGKEIELSDFIINPNPTKGLLNITAATGFNKTIHLSLINVLGQEIINKAWNPSMGGKTTSLDIENYSKGVYFLTLQSEDKKLYVKIVKD